MKKKKTSNPLFNKVINKVPYIITAIFTLAGVLVSLNRFWQYEVFYFDFGIFDKAIWQVSRLMPPVIDHTTIGVGGKWIFADHFSPSIFLLSPLYWLTDKQEVILAAQAIIVGISGIFLYKISQIVINNRLISNAILISYFLFVGLQNAIISDFHESTIMVLPLILIYYALVKNNKWIYFISLLITLGLKESTFLLAVGIGISVILIKRDWFKIGLLTILIGILWGVISIKFIIPIFSGGSYQYGPSMSYNPIDILVNLFNNDIKRRTLFYTFESFGFLPLLSPPFWFLILQDFVIRFVPSSSNLRWDLGLHYSAQTASIMALSSVFGIKTLQKIKTIKKYLPVLGILLILNSIILFRFVLNGPFGLFYNQAFYSHSADFKFLDVMTEKIPKDASVMAPNNILPRFTHQNSWLLRTNYIDYKPDYVIIDTREGQNPNNFTGVDNLKQVKQIVNSLKGDKRYKEIFSTKEQFIFKKNN